MNDEVEHAIGQCMTARQIGQRLLELDDQDAPVFFICGYGDRGNTQQALPVAEITDASTTDLAETGYSASNVYLKDDDPDNPPTSEELEDAMPVVILQS